MKVNGNNMTKKVIKKKILAEPKKRQEEIARSYKRHDLGPGPVKVYTKEEIRAYLENQNIDNSLA